MLAWLCGECCAELLRVAVVEKGDGILLTDISAKGGRILFEDSVCF